MDTKPLLEGEGLYKLIPQRNPIVMVDTFFSATETDAECLFFNVCVFHKNALLLLYKEQITLSFVNIRRRSAPLKYTKI